MKKARQSQSGHDRLCVVIISRRNDRSHFPHNAKRKHTKCVAYCSDVSGSSGSIIINDDADEDVAGAIKAVLSCHFPLLSDDLIWAVTLNDCARRGRLSSCE